MSLWQWITNLFSRTPSPSAPPLAIVPPPAPMPPPRALLVARPDDLPLSNHYASRDRNLLSKEYNYLWSICQIMPSKMGDARFQASRAILLKPQYVDVAAVFKMPWFVIAAISHMESGQNMASTLLNGDPYSRPTTHFPAHLGPWKTWKEAAIYAVNYEDEGWHFNPNTWEWDVDGVFYFLHMWNGFNDREAEGADLVPPNASPYLYAATPFYQRGKRVEEWSEKKKRYVGRFDPTKVSDQVGCMAFLKAIELQGEKIF